MVIPDKALSWIAKAHPVGKSLTARAVCPVAAYGASEAAGVRCSHPSCQDGSKTADDPLHHWLVVDGPPASCVQLGLFHRLPSSWSSKYHQHNGHPPSSDPPPQAQPRPSFPLDLVISGPNHGRNASTLYALSSGTVGGALEGALAGVRSVALSFASKDPQPRDIVDAACKTAVRVIEALAAGFSVHSRGRIPTWDDGVELYSVNVPMIPTVETAPVVATTPSRVLWSTSSSGLFRAPELEEGSQHKTAVTTNGTTDTPTSGVNEVKPSSQGLGNGLATPTAANGDPNSTAPATTKTTNYVFRWAPDLSDVAASEKETVEGEDLWASLNGYVG